MTIRLNGEPREIAGPLPIADLLAQLDIDPRRVAVEHNLAIVKRERYADTMIDEGDTVEIVNFVGGGRQPVPGIAAPAFGSWRVGFGRGKLKDS